MITLVATLDSQIFDAYQQLKKARLEGDYDEIVRCMSRVDALLDQRAAMPSGSADRRRRANREPH